MVDFVGEDPHKVELTLNTNTDANTDANTNRINTTKGYAGRQAHVQVVISKQ
jgi:hypothetical protein